MPLLRVTVCMMWLGAFSTITLAQESQESLLINKLEGIGIDASGAIYQVSWDQPMNEFRIERTTDAGLQTVASGGLHAAPVHLAEPGGTGCVRRHHGEGPRSRHERTVPLQGDGSCSRG